MSVAVFHVIYCDRCGKQLTDDDKNAIVEKFKNEMQYHPLIVLPEANLKRTRVLDLCPECQEALQPLMKCFLGRK